MKLSVRSKVILHRLFPTILQYYIYIYYIYIYIIHIYIIYIYISYIYILNVYYILYIYIYIFIYIANKPRIPLVLKFKRTLPNIKKIIDEHWHLLQINSKLKNTFQANPIIAYKRNKNLKEIIGSNKILNNKVIRKIKKQKRSTFFVAHVTQEVIIFVVNSWKTQTS